MSKTNIWTGPCGIPEIKKIETCLDKYQIMIIDGNNQLNTPIYLNKDAKYDRYLYLCLYKEHYYAISSMRRFLNKDYYCHNCTVGFRHLGNHRCNLTMNLAND